jgi:hypothetical protein
MVSVPVCYPFFSGIAKSVFLLGEPHLEEERAAVNDETDMLESLTGIPLPEDEILFAVPVCAPYATLLNYKFKGDNMAFFLFFLFPQGKI